MTDTLVYPSAAPNRVDFVISHLRPYGATLTPAVATYATRKQGDDLPQWLVNALPGEPDPRMELIADDGTVSVHSFGVSYTAASDLGDLAHRRMLVLVNDPTVIVTLNDGSPANAQYVDTVQKPVHVDYAEPDIWRFVSRYKLGLAFV